MVWDLLVVPHTPRLDGWDFLLWLKSIQYLVVMVIDLDFVVSHRVSLLSPQIVIQIHRRNLIINMSEWGLWSSGWYKLLLCLLVDHLDNLIQGIINCFWLILKLLHSFLKVLSFIWWFTTWEILPYSRHLKLRLMRFHFFLC